MESEQEWEKEGEERDCSPGRVYLQSVIPLGGLPSALQLPSPDET